MIKNIKGQITEVTYPFSINNKKLDGEFLDNIIENIKIGYKRIYPSSVITVEYKAKKLYTFMVYATLTVIENSLNVVQNVLLKEYTNIEAISGFSIIPFHRYLEKYDDSQKNYLEEFKKEVNKIIDDSNTAYNVTLKLMGQKSIEFKPLEINGRDYCFAIEGIGWSHIEVVCGRFRFDNIITKEELKNHLVSVKRQIKEKMERRGLL